MSGCCYLFPRPLPVSHCCRVGRDTCLNLLIFFMAIIPTCPPLRLPAVAVRLRSLRRCFVPRRWRCEVGKHTGAAHETAARNECLVPSRLRLCGCAPLWLAEGFAPDEVSLVNALKFICLQVVANSWLWRSNQGSQMSNTRHLTNSSGRPRGQIEAEAREVVPSLGDLLLLGTPSPSAYRF